MVLKSALNWMRDGRHHRKLWVVSAVLFIPLLVCCSRPDQLWRLWEATGQLPYNRCAAYTATSIRLSRVSHLIIALSYLWIPLSGIRLLWRVGWDRRHNIILVLFAAFILGCGLGHLLEFITTYRPIVMAAAIENAFTAAASIFTAVVWHQITGRVSDVDAHQPEVDHVIARASNRTWELAGGCVALGLFAALGVISWVSANESIIASDKRKQTYDAVLLLDSALKYLTEAEAAQRGYVLTGNEQYLKLYRDSHRKFAPLMGRLAGTRLFDRKQLDRLRVTADKKLSEMDLTIVARRSEGEQVAKDLVKNDVGLWLMLQVRADVDRIRVGAMAQVDRFDQRSKKYSSFALVFIPLVGSFNIVLAVYAASSWRDRTLQRERLRLLQQRAWEEKERAWLEKERAERNLNVAKQQFQWLVNSIGDYAIFLIDVDGTILTWNQGAERIKGYHEADVIGKNFSIFYTPEQLKQQEPARALEAVQQTGEFHEEDWRIKQDGTRFWASISIAAIYDQSGTVVSLIKVTRDLTLKRQQELTIQRAESLFRTTIDLAPNAVVVADAAGSIVVWNDAAVRIFGYAHSEVVGKNITLLMPDRYRESHSLGMSRVVETGNMPLARHPLELYGLHKDGSEFPLEVTLNGTRLTDEWLFFAVLRDTTQIRQVEREMRRLNVELRRTNAELSRSNGELDQFAVIASHDLKSPLRQIVSYGQLLERRYGEQLDDDGLQFIAYMVDGATRMQTLINDLLTFARTGSGEWRPVAVDMNRVVELALRNLDGTMAERRASISRQDDYPAVFGDESQLVQVLQNLLSNAIKFSPGSPKISIGSRPHGAGWEFWVQDDGIGIDPLHVDQIWTMFKRLNGNTYQGTGIGLSIVRKVVDRHGGSVRVESALGKGSTFYVLLPAVPHDLDSGR